MQYEVYKAVNGQIELVGIVARKSAAMNACRQLGSDGSRVWMKEMRPTRQDIRAVHVSCAGDSPVHRDFSCVERAV